jgi:hypothetical protein
MFILTLKSQLLFSIMKAFIFIDFDRGASAVRQQPLPRCPPDRPARHHGPTLAHHRHLREHAGRPGVNCTLIKHVIIGF